MFLDGAETVAPLGRVGLPPVVGSIAAGVVIGPHTPGMVADATAVAVGAPLLLARSPRLAAGARLLEPVERLVGARPADTPLPEAPAPDRHRVLAGLGPGGRTLLRVLEAARVPPAALELDPETVARERVAGRNVHDGDATGLEARERVGRLARARQVVLPPSRPRSTRRAAAAVRGRCPRIPWGVPAPHPRPRRALPGERRAVPGGDRPARRGPGLAGAPAARSRGAAYAARFWTAKSQFTSLSSQAFT